MHTCYAYSRVSTVDQQIQGNSIPEQLSRIKTFCNQNNITVIKEFTDSDSAYKENREGFNALIEQALRERPDFIIMDDSSPL